MYEYILFEAVSSDGFGIGLGIGNIISRLVDKKSVYEEAKRLFGKKGKFSEGFALGFASSSIANLLSDDQGRNDDENNNDGLLLC